MHRYQALPHSLLPVSYIQCCTLAVLVVMPTTVALLSSSKNSAVQFTARELGVCQSRLFTVAYPVTCIPAVCIGWQHACLTFMQRNITALDLDQPPGITVAVPELRMREQITQALVPMYLHDLLDLRSSPFIVNDNSPLAGKTACRATACMYRGCVYVV